MHILHILEVASVICGILNWGMVCGFLRANEADNIKSQAILLVVVVAFSVFSFVPLLLSGCFRFWAWYPETERERIAKLTLKKLES